MPLVVVDTNVPLVANLMHPAAGPECVNRCVQALLDVTEGRCRLALDDEWRIIREYGHKLSASGQPGVGDMFLKWVLTNQGNPSRCETVRITPRPEDDRDFEEFPRHPGLTAFDLADRKFVAVAANHPERPPIQQAVDRKWWEWRTALGEAGVEVDFLCPDEVGADAR